MHSEDDNDEVKSQFDLNSSSEGQFWIGFKEYTIFGWGWSDGDRTEYANWQRDMEPKEPQFDETLGCAVMDSTTGDAAGKWYEIDCEETRPYVC